MSSIDKARAEARKWAETSERLVAQLDKARADLGQEKERRAEVVLPARTGDAGAKERLAAHDAKIKELKREVAELEQAAADAQARQHVAAARVEDVERAAVERQAAKLEAEAHKAAIAVDDALADVRAALERCERLIEEATKTRGRPVERRVPVMEALRRAQAWHRIGDIHAVHQALHMKFAEALRFEQAREAPVAGGTRSEA